MISYRYALICLAALTYYSPVAGQDLRPGLATECGFILEVEHPDQLLDKVTAISPAFDHFGQLCNALIHLDNQGIERKSSKSGKIELLFSTESTLYLVVERSESKLGNIAILFNNSEQPPIEDCILCVRNCLNWSINLLPFLSKPTESEQLEEHAKQLSDSLVGADSAGWRIIASSQEFLDSLKPHLSGTAPVPPNRKFMESLNYYQGDSDIEVFWDTRFAKQIMIGLGFYSAESWDRLKVEETPWVVNSCYLEMMEGKRYAWSIESTYASTVPLTGANRLNEIFDPLSKYPRMPEEATGYSIESFNLKELTAFNQTEFDKLYGNGLLEKLHSDPITKLEMGVGREQLGNTMVTLNYGFNHKEKLKLFSVDFPDSQSIASAFATRYLDALRQDDATGKSLIGSYENGSHLGIPVQWSKKLEDRGAKVNQMMQWLSEQDPLAPPKSIPDDFGIAPPSTVTVSSHREMIDKDLFGYRKATDATQRKFAGIESGKGAVLFPNWVAVGNWYQINTIANWEQRDVEYHKKLIIDGSSDVYDQECILTKQDRFHYFEVERKEDAQAKLNGTWQLLTAPLGRRGTISPQKRQLLEEDPKDAATLSLVQRVRYRVESINRDLSQSSPMRVETRHIRPGKTHRQTTRVTWHFNASEQ